MRDPTPTQPTPTHPTPTCATEQLGRRAEQSRHGGAVAAVRRWRGRERRWHLQSGRIAVGERRPLVRGVVARCTVRHQAQTCGVQLGAQQALQPRRVRVRPCLVPTADPGHDQAVEPEAVVLLGQRDPQRHADVERGVEVDEPPHPLVREEPAVVGVGRRRCRGVGADRQRVGDPLAPAEKRTVPVAVAQDHPPVREAPGQRSPRPRVPPGGHVLEARLHRQRRVVGDGRRRPGLRVARAQGPRHPCGTERVEPLGELRPRLPPPRLGRRVLACAGSPGLLPEVPTPAQLVGRQSLLVGVDVDVVGEDPEQQLVPAVAAGGEPGLQPDGEEGQRTVGARHLAEHLLQPVQRRLGRRHGSSSCPSAGSRSTAWNSTRTGRCRLIAAM